MKIVIDVNTLPHVFNQKDENHYEFEPVYNRVNEGRCNIVFGGTKYKSELAKMPNYLKLINIYKDKGIAIPLCDDDIDLKEIEIIKIVPIGRFNDQHLVAIVIISRCTVICTKDLAAIPFLRDQRFYPRGIPRPKFYTKRRNISLLKRYERKN
jgi:hypothetical protein